MNHAPKRIPPKSLIILAMLEAPILVIAVLRFSVFRVESAWLLPWFIATVVAAASSVSVYVFTVLPSMRTPEGVTDEVNKRALSFALAPLVLGLALAVAGPAMFDTILGAKS